MKRKLSLFLMLLFSVFTLAQKTVSGKITDEDGVGIPSASVTIEEPGKDAIIAYGITNAKGEYKISFTSSESTLDFKVKAFNQKTVTKQISNQDQTQSFSLESQATEIKEVQLKTKMITARGDTISYDLKAFDSKNDRTLADVMRKIPGIEVKADGSITYQGNPINKFLVEGKDLMEGGYGTINNSLPKDAVAKVEVLENHQPVKMLQGKIPSDAAAINIKLKKAVTITGRGEVGAGLEPLLWNVKLTPMFFSKKHQWVVNYKTNNAGEQVENEGNMLGSFSRWEGRRVNATQDDWLNVENASVPNLPVKRYLFNNVHYVSANYLTNIDKNKEWELKAIANYTNNVVERESYNQREFFATPTRPGYVITTDIYNRFFTDKLKGELIFTKNAKKGYFKNTSSFTQFWNADRAQVSRSNSIAGNAAQAIESPTTAFQNSLSTIIPWKEKMVNVTSFIDYKKDVQRLGISPASYLSQIPEFNPGVYATEVLQNIRLNSFTANHSANIGFTYKGFTLTPEIGFNFDTTDLRSVLASTQQGNYVGYGADFDNDLKYTAAQPYAALGVNFRNDTWMLYANFPVNSNNIKAEDPVRLVNRSLNKITFEPTIFAQYNFAFFFKFSVNANVNNNFGEINTAYSGFILTSPDNINAMDSNNPIPENINKSAGARLEYRNPLNNIFFNVNYRLSDAKRNLIANTAIDNGYFITQYIVQDNTILSNFYSAEIGKYFPGFKTNASLSFTNNTSESDRILSNAAYTNINTNQSFSVKFNNTYFSWMSVDYNASITRNRQRSTGAIDTDARNSGYNHNLAVFFYPLENHTVGLNWDQINTKAPNNEYKNAFYDLSYQYTWSKKKIDFELKWMNIANRKVFETYNFSATEVSYNRVSLRPSQVMFTVKFNFK